MFCFEQILEVAPDQTTIVRPVVSHHKKKKKETNIQGKQDTLGIAGEVRSVLPKTYLKWPIKDTGCCLEDRPGSIHNGLWESKEPMLHVRLNDGDKYIIM